MQTRFARLASACLSLLALPVPLLHAAEPEPGSLFNGRDLTGWVVPEGNDERHWYTAHDGVLHLQSGPERKGSILWTKHAYRNFLFTCEFKFGEGTVDSGVHVRNQDQIQIGISGSLKRDMTASPYIPGKGYPVEARNVAKLLRAEDWNELKIRVVGAEYTVWLNGEQVMEYVSDTAIAEGPIGLQLHGGKDMAISYRRLQLAELE